jgi:sec-independent protein translocase protein TatC
MATTELAFAIGLIVALLVIPLFVMLLVRVLVRDDPPMEEEVAEVAAEFESLGDFWVGMAPHLFELRDRLIKSVIAIAIGTAIGFWIVNSPNLLGRQLPDLMIAHFAPGETLQALTVGETFVSYMRIALVVGFAIAMPVVVYQVIAFFSPGLLAYEKRIVYTALPFVTELFLAGLAFGWYFSIPAALNFLLHYGETELIKPQPSLESFISTVATLLLWNGAIFEMPAIVYLLARLGIVTAKTLARTRRYAIVIITILAAVITPTPDPWNLMILAIPMYLLYELGILLARFVPVRTADGEAQAAGST